MRWIVEKEITVIRTFEVDAPDMQTAMIAADTLPHTTETELKSETTSATKASQYKPRTPKKKPAAPRAARATRIPDDFKPDIEYGVTLGLHRRKVEREAMDFRDYWKARPGAGGTKLDWPATWRTWIRRTADKLGAVPVVPSPGASTSRTNFTKEDWDRALKLYNMTHNWNPAYGPPPGRPGYQGPEPTLF
jgi:hypothetical protein